MNQSNALTRRLTLCFLASGIASSQVALAQTVEDTDDRRLAPVIITTQKTEENLQSAPLAVTAFSGAELESRGIVDLKGITERSPGFTMGEFNPGQTQLYIRGIGSNEDAAGGDQSVVVFLDEAYIGRSAGQDLDLFDIERVEVLRGPQGTLFGRNVVGGVVNVITKKPHDTFEAAVEGTVGTYNLQTLRGKVNIPLSDTVFTKFSFSKRDRDGYIKNRIYDIVPEITGLDVPRNLRNIDKFNARAGLRWLAADNVDVNITASYSTVDEQAANGHSVDGTPATPLALSQLIPGYEDSYRYVAVTDAGVFENEVYGLVANVEWSISDTLTFNSITSYRDVSADHVPGNIIASQADIDYAMRTIALGQLAITGANYYTDASETLTQELRLGYAGDRINAVGGLYYLEEDARRNECMSLSVFPLPTLPSYQTNPNNLSGCDNAKNLTTSAAVFGQVTYNFTDRVSVVAGGRYTADEKHNRQIGNASPAASGPTENFNTDVTADWDAFTGKIGVNFQATDDIFLYGVISEGYKSGGFGPGLSTTASQAATPFDPEFATMMELGAKSEWFNNNLRLNLAYSDTDYDDLQILQLMVPADAPAGTPGILLTQNAASAKIKAIEAEFIWAVTKNLTLSGNYAHLDSEYTDFFVPAGYRPPSDLPVDTSRSGNPLRNAPENAYNLNIRYTIDLPGGSELALLVDHRHKDTAYQDPDALEFAAVPEHDLTDFSATWTNAMRNLDVTVFGTNVFDEDYAIHNYPVSGNGVALAGAPQMFGLRVGYRFGS
ncbi:TonB-dependent receptor [Hyphomonas sp. NPDC076900]|uniref:TonB-dependent receptor n=1 Tax=unclassified Hyphomonas TaxID=2630699 RepID=UPI003D04EE2F